MIPLPAMSPSGFSTQAVLLRKIEYGDHDYIITFLTRDMGKVSVMAKNAKKSVKRFTGALDLFSLNQIQCRYPQKNRDGMIILSQTELENGFINIRYDLFKTAFASYWVELVYLWLEEEKSQPALYDLLVFSLDMLNSSDISPQVLNLLYQIRFMSISGFTPSIDSCETCKTELDAIIQKNVRFDLQEGKIICESCLRKTALKTCSQAGGPGHGLYVSKGTLKQLFWINNTDISRADRIKFSPFAMAEGQALMESFIPFHIGREMRTLKFLNRLRREL